VACKLSIRGVAGPFRGLLQKLRKVTNLMHNRTCLERQIVEGDSPVGEMCKTFWEGDPSITGHEKPCENPGGPSPKAKY
jgi:hypothetical protein